MLKENKDNIDQHIYNFLRRRHEVKEKVLGEDDYAITVYTLIFDIKGEMYSFNNYVCFFNLFLEEIFKKVFFWSYRRKYFFYFRWNLFHQ
jgi:hypothetical protein